MVNAHVSTEREPFHVPVPWPRHIDRLMIVPSAGAPTPEAAQQVAATAVARLRAAGLSCHGTSTPRLQILGGTGTFVERGVRGYEEPFAILEEQDGKLTAMVAGTQTAPDEEAPVDTLADALAFVLRIYRARGSISTPK